MFIEYITLFLSISLHSLLFILPYYRQHKQNNESKHDKCSTVPAQYTTDKPTTGHITEDNYALVDVQTEPNDQQYLC